VDGGLPSPRGSTLAELVLVLALVAVLAGLIIPVYRATLDRAALNAAASELKTTLRWVQERSLADGARWEVRFDVAASAYGVYREAMAVEGPAAVRSGVRLVAADFGGQPVVSFGYGGVASAAGCVWLASEGGRRVRVAVTGAAARIEVLEGDGPCPP